VRTSGDDPTTPQHKLPLEVGYKKMGMHKHHTYNKTTKNKLNAQKTHTDMRKPWKVK
jgi:hypothetical protein